MEMTYKNGFICVLYHIRRDNGLYQALEVLASDEIGYLS